MEVWPYSAVQERKAAFLVLMATGNFDAAFALAEDEFSVMSRLAREMRMAKPEPGKNLWDTVLEHVLPLLGN
eukprot:12975047-Alexandrium_andersonii.AAC.1